MYLITLHLWNLNTTTIVLIVVHINDIGHYNINYYTKIFKVSNNTITINYHSPFIARLCIWISKQHIRDYN